MREIIEWLSTVEDAAARIYKKASKRFGDDKDFSEFLNLLAEDERTHAYVIRKALELTEGSRDLPVLIYLSEDTKREIESYLGLFENRVESKKLTREKLIDYIIAIESAEGNDLFLYIVNTLKHRFKDFIPFAAKIQQHKRRIESYVRAHPELRDFIERTSELTSVWKEKFLVVDNKEGIADALRAILDDEGSVETARAGEEALKRIDHTYYAAVLVGADSPLVQEEDLYMQAVGKFPEIKERLLFFTSPADDERVRFLKANNLRYLSKPAQIKDIKKAVEEIISR